MPALSGSDKAYKQARAGIERAGASRAGYFIPNVVVTINGAAVVVKHESISIELKLNEQPDTASFLMKPGTAVPTAGNIVVIGLGTAANAEFAGQVIDVELEWTQGLSDPWIRVSCIDWSRVFNGLLITGDFSGQSATDIARTIVSDYTSGFFDYAIELGMATVDEFLCDNELPARAFGRLAHFLGGGSYVDAAKIVHLWDFSGPSSAYQPTPPTTITTALSTLKAFRSTSHSGQVRTRVIVQGRDVKILYPITAGEAAVATYGVPVDYAWPLAPKAGTVKVKHELLTYTNVWAYAGLPNLGPYWARLTADANPGDTTVAVDAAENTIVIRNNTIWVMDDSGYTFVCESPSGGGLSTLTDVPASGYGAIQKTIKSGTAVRFCDALLPGVSVPVTEIESGESAYVYEIAEDVVAQAAVAAASGIAGDTGIREHFISDPSLSYAGAEARAAAELAVFSAALTRASWTTYDMNAKPGAQQAINITGIGALSTTLTVESVSLEFPLPDHPPRRTCEAGDVKLETILDAIRG